MTCEFFYDGNDLEDEIENICSLYSTRTVRTTGERIHSKLTQLDQVPLLTTLGLLLLHINVRIGGGRVGSGHYFASGPCATSDLSTTSRICLIFLSNDLIYVGISKKRLYQNLNLILCSLDTVLVDRSTILCHYSVACRTPLATFFLLYRCSRLLRFLEAFLPTNGCCIHRS